MMNRTIVVGVLAVLLAGCSERANFCTRNSDCTDPAFPFCDVNGQFPDSGGSKNVCIRTPEDCPVAQCGCTAGAVLSCANDQLTTCSSDGESTSSETCASGCAADNSRCATFVPSNGLASALAMAVGEPTVDIPSGSVIDTSSGTVAGPDGQTIAVASSLVDQGGSASPIRVLVAGNFTIGSVTVAGSSPLALVANTTISISGDISARAVGATAGPGGQASSTCDGSDETVMSCNSTPCGAGAGGGGNATAGGAGGDQLAAGAPGGATLVDSSLVGGCRGGNQMGTVTIFSAGGGGGGALQLVAGQSITLTAGGFIDVGGGGGSNAAGGGSGGFVILESPAVSFDDGTGIAANGGAGGGCGQAGPDAGPDEAAALGPTCAESAGNGGTGGVAATPGSVCVQMFCQQGVLWGGGGGSAGRVRIATRTGTPQTTGSVLLSAQLMAVQLHIQ